jgi:hypothetical protein
VARVQDDTDEDLCLTQVYEILEHALGAITVQLNKGRGVLPPPIADDGMVVILDERGSYTLEEV